MNDSNFSEKRSTPRVGVDKIPVEIYESDGISILGIGYLMNLGINCAGLETTLNMQKNQEFFMRFLLERKYLINVSARIMRKVLKESSKYYGLQFIKTDILHEKDLKLFLEKKLQALKDKL